MKKVFVNAGHGGTDPGAVGFLVEKDVNLSMALACQNFLMQNGVIVQMSRTGDVNNLLTEVIKKCNAFAPDLAVDIHNNSGGGKGFECYFHFKGGASKTLAENIEQEVLKMGQNSRGCKVRLNSNNTDYYGFIRETKAPAVILEGVFVDNAEDVKMADTPEKQRKFGEAYARGILKTLGITPKEPEPLVDPEPSEVTYYVQVGAYKNKENAQKQLEKAKQAGFQDAFIKVFEVNYG